MALYRVKFDGNKNGVRQDRYIEARYPLQAAENVCGPNTLLTAGMPGQPRVQVWDVNQPAAQYEFYLPPEA